MLKFSFKLVNDTNINEFVTDLPSKPLSVSVIGDILSNSYLSLSNICRVDDRFIDAVQERFVMVDFSYEELFEYRIEKLFEQCVIYDLRIDQETMHSLYTYTTYLNSDKEFSIVYKFDQERFLTWLYSTDLYKVLYQA